MNTSPHRPQATRAAGNPWPLALVGALASASVAALVLRPRKGLIRADPVDVSAYFASDDIARARRFGRPQLVLQAASGAVQAGVLAGFAARARRRLGEGAPTSGRETPASGGGAPASGAPAPAHPLRDAAAMGAGLTLAVELAPLPLRALARRRARAVGLSTQTWRGWAGDVAKGGALGVALNTAAAPVGVALMRRFPRSWWLPAAGVAVAGTGALTFLSPVLLDPLFNRFTPLPAGSVREAVLELAERAGVRVREIYEVDASRRTRAANAYVTGLGATKRVVLFDTLLRELTLEEVRLVVAHELAHVRHRDVPRGLAHLALSAPAGMYAVAQLTRRLERGRQPSAASLPALALALGAVSAAVGSLSCALSRTVERRADAFSLTLTDAPEPFVSFEQRLVRQNLIDPDPPRLLVALLGTHPATIERIGIARAYARGARPGA